MVVLAALGMTMVAVLPLLMVLLQGAAFLMAVIVTIVYPAVANADVAKVPVPAAMVTDAVEPVAVLSPVRLYVTV